MELSVRELSIVAQERAVRNGDVDVALLCPPPPDVTVQPVAFERLVACVSRRHPLAGASSLTYADLEGQRFPGVHPDVPRYWANAFAPPAASPGISRSDAMPLTPEEVQALLISGHIVTLCPEFLVRRHADAPLVAIPIADAPLLPVAFATVRANDPIVAAFLKFVRDRCRRRADTPPLEQPPTADTSSTSASPLRAA